MTRYFAPTCNGISEKCDQYGGQEGNVWDFGGEKTEGKEIT